MKKKKWYQNAMLMAALFGVLNVVMYLTIHKFWIGGSSFLPMVGKVGKNNAFLFAFIVNMGVIAGAFIGAVVSKEFCLRWPKTWGTAGRAILGGILIGIGVTLCPGTCTTAFVTGMPMFSVSSCLSAAGIFIGAFIVFRIMSRKRGL